MLLKNRKRTIIILSLVGAIVASMAITGGVIALIDNNNVRNRNYVCKEEEKIYLIGETHGKEKQYQKELAKWKDFYNNDGYRHLFVEIPYYCGEILNLWMKEESNERLDYFYDSIDGTLSHVPSYKEFLINIKKECPQTIFHGTDVGHIFGLLGNYYISYLEDKGLKDSDNYRLTMENYTQYLGYRESGSTNGKSDVRENYMVENFKREYDALPIGTKIMGIYGSYHTDPRKKDLMANKLKAYYGDCITYHYASYVK